MLNISYNTTTISGSTSTIVTTQEVVDYLRLPTGTSEYNLINDFIISAELYIEEYTNNILLDKIFDVYFDGFYSSLILPYNPVSNIESIKYYDIDNNENILSTDVYDYDFTKLYGEISLKYEQNWPSTVLRTVKPIVVRFTAGFGSDSSSIPKMLKIAALLLISDMYENRVTQLPIKLYENMTVKNLLGPYVRARYL